MSTSQDHDMSNYKASFSTGVYGSYCIRYLPPDMIGYRPSYSSGVYGSYTVGSNITHQQKYTYLPSISSGIFGTWKYNESSPSTLVPTIKPKPTPNTDNNDHTALTQTIQSNEKQMLGKRRGYGLFRQREEIDYKFEIQGPRNEDIIDGRKYNVKLLQEFTVPVTKQQQPNGSNTGTLYICEGSVVSFNGECIVNAANEGMLGGGGVDGAISSAGGDALYYLREQEPLVANSKYVRCKTGDAKITQSGYPYNRLKCDYVIHAVGPNYSVMYRAKQMKMTDIDHLLYSSYAKTMLLCKARNIKSVGFCLISSGIFRGPRSLEDVLRIGIKAIRDYMFPGIEVYVIGYTNSELVCLSKVAPNVLGEMTKEYAKVKEKKGWGNRWSSRDETDDRNDTGQGGMLSWLFSKKKGNKGKKAG
eukprot:250683_1